VLVGHWPRAAADTHGRWQLRTPEAWQDHLEVYEKPVRKGAFMCLPVLSRTSAIFGHPNSVATFVWYCLQLRHGQCCHRGVDRLFRGSA
jgi:hypothetical protein